MNYRQMMALTTKQKIGVLELSKKYAKEGTCTCHSILKALKEIFTLGERSLIFCTNIQMVFKMREASKGVKCNPNRRWWFDSYDEIDLPDRLQLINNMINILKNEK